MTMTGKLEVETPSDREVRVTREFRATAQLVWDAYTKPDLLKKWLAGHDGWSMPVCDMDVRVGGSYRWLWRNVENQQEFGFFGKFIEVKPLARLVFEQHYNPGSLGIPMTNEPAIISHVFVEANGVTTLTVTMLFASQDERDSAMATDMTGGMEQNYQHLDAMLAS
jgi:uncharacterized protein YndB with AHSA1/START domain